MNFTVDRCQHKGMGMIGFGIRVKIHVFFGGQGRKRFDMRENSLVPQRQYCFGEEGILGNAVQIHVEGRPICLHGRGLAGPRRVKVPVNVANKATVGFLRDVRVVVFLVLVQQIEVPVADHVRFLDPFLAVLVGKDFVGFSLFVLHQVVDSNVFGCGVLKVSHGKGLKKGQDYKRPCLVVGLGIGCDFIGNIFESISQPFLLVQSSIRQCASKLLIL